MPTSRPPRAQSSSTTKGTAEPRAARKPAADREARTGADALPALRTAFLAAVARDTPGSDLARYTEVLDELLAWAASHADRVAAAPAAATPSQGVISFAPVAGVAGPRWSLRPVRGEGPVVELQPATGVEQEAQGARIRTLFNSHSRAALGPDARLRIGFGALKNPAARAALLALLEDLVREAPAAPAEPAAEPVAETSPETGTDAPADATTADEA
jgi:transposase